MYRKKKTRTTPAMPVIQKNDMSNDEFLQDLNSEQKRAVTCSTDQSTLVLSGAGLFNFFPISCNL